MKKFLKYVLATIVGLAIVNILFFMIAMGVIGSMAAMGDQTVSVKDNSILEISFSNEIQDRASSNPIDNFDFFSFSTSQPLGLNKILENIDKAAKDSRIKGIYMNLTDINSSFGAMATIEEIRNALLEFKKSGKFIYSYANFGYSQKSYFLATVSDSVFVNPETPLGLLGMRSQTSFYKNVLDKLGIKSEILKVGKYKSAVEPFVQTEMSKENREQVFTYITSVWNAVTKGISEERNVSVEELNTIADNFDYRSAEEEVKLGLFDGAIYEDQMIDILKTRCGLKADDKLPYITFEKYLKAEVEGTKKASTKDKIAVIYASGEIGMKQSGVAIGPELAETIRNARKDKNVKAIVLRINSPGGSALTSDIIWREVKLAAEAKPFIASMGNVAASGGYYIACAADTIIADPTTLTGSIGVFGLLFSGEKLIKETIGVTTDGVKTNKYSDFGGSFPLPLPVSSRAFTAYERSVMQRSVEQTYETFLSRVTEGRGMSRDAVHEIAQGRVWTGTDALKLGLVDMLGGYNDAIRLAAEKAGLENYKIAEYPAEKNPFDEIFSGLTASIKTRILKEELGVYYDTYNFIKEMTQASEGVVARIPYNITIE